LTDVLVDSSIWVAHFRKGNEVLQSLLEADRVLCHPLIVLEIACGTPPAPRERTIGDLKRLRQSVVATTDETLALMERERLQGLGCGAVDLALLASAILTPESRLWTVDRNLDVLARRMDVDFREDSG
jgi:predicted nucleic acid-binding protein